MNDAVSRHAQTLLDLLASENEALARGDFGRIADLLASKTASVEAIKASLKSGPAPDAVSRARWKRQAERLAEAAAENETSLQRALAVQRNVVELLIHQLQREARRNTHAASGAYQDPRRAAAR